MSVKVTTSSKTPFIGDDRSPLKSQEISLANKLDNITSGIALQSSKSMDSSDHLRKDKITNTATKTASVMKKWRRSSEKAGPPTPHATSNKKRTPKFEKQKEKIKLPTKFLLGGNINDPLNLNSMNDEEVNKALNAETPVSSPLPTPSHRNQKVEVLIPPNINDPLNLNSGEDIDVALVSPRGLPKKRKKNKRKKSTEPGLADGSDNPVLEPPQPPEKDLSTELTIKIDTKPPRAAINEIVSPAIPQDSPKPKRKRTTSDPKVSIDSEVESPTKGMEKLKMKKTVPLPTTSSKAPTFRSQDGKFAFGNYNRYYGKRNPEIEDQRLDLFKKEWFDGKDVLDIGCNIGHVTLSVARDFGPNSITGMDVDGKLVSIARKNVRHYMSTSAANPSRFPVSLPSTHGPIAAPAIKQDRKAFPDNINFVQGNYVLDNDELLALQKEEYDVIMALSITKWLHLNYGDSGLKRSFKRMFRQLRPGGKLILEPQSWSSYKKKKKLNETIWKNFKAIELKPDRFKKYLLTEVGFSKSEYLDVPFNKSKGFQRPILLLTKPDTSQTTPREVTESRGVTPLMNIECGHHNYTPRFYSGTPTTDMHPSYSFSSTHMPIRGYDAFLETGQVAYTPTQELFATAARGITPRFDVGTPSVSARNTPSQALQYSDSEGQWSQEDGPLFEPINQSGFLDNSSRENSQDYVNTTERRCSNVRDKETLSEPSVSAVSSSQSKSLDSQESSVSLPTTSSIADSQPSSTCESTETANDAQGSGQSQISNDSQASCKVENDKTTAEEKTTADSVEIFKETKTEMETSLSKSGPNVETVTAEIDNSSTL